MTDVIPVDGAIPIPISDVAADDGDVDDGISVPVSAEFVVAAAAAVAKDRGDGVSVLGTVIDGSGDDGINDDPMARCGMYGTALDCKPVDDNDDEVVSFGADADASKEERGRCRGSPMPMPILCISISWSSSLLVSVLVFVCVSLILS